MKFDEKTAYEILNDKDGVSIEEFRRTYCEEAGIKFPEDSTFVIARLWRSRSAPKVEDVRNYLKSLKLAGRVERTGSNDHHRLSPEGRGYFYNFLTHE